jgi:Tol biopolymer transport system component/DNA-binding winged helix-turn-helix (wHTH) protein
MWEGRAHSSVVHSQPTFFRVCGMDVPANARRRLGFGLFEADLSAHELYRRGVLVHVQDQPLQILAMLLEHPGDVVTREELQKKLWPGDTFVDFDEGLNTAVKKLRYALGDSPENPTFIETIPRRGYRLIAPIRILGDLPDDESGRTEIASPLETADPHTNPNRASETTEADIVLPGSDPDLRESETARETFPFRAPSVALSNPKSRKRVTWAVSAALLVLAIVVAIGYWRHFGTPQRAMHFSVPLRTAMRDLALSPDGRVLAFVAPLPKDGGTALWIHEIGGSGAHVLENTEDAAYPFWSPDNRFIAFFADGKLKKIEAAGGPVQIICDAPIGRGGTWNRDGVIVFAADSGVALRRVSDAGGHATMLPGFEQKVSTTMSNRWPVFLPDGKHFLYSSVDFGTDLDSEANAIYVAALDSKEHRRLVTSNANGAYIAPSYLLFSRNKTLMAQRFDANQLQLTGDAFAVANEVEYLSSVARALFSVSKNGTLVYQSGSGATFSQLAWFDREGKQISTLGPPARYANPRLSADGKRVAVDVDDPQSSNTDVWVFEAHHHVPSRFTFDPGQDESPLWAHNGRRILWLSDRGDKNGFYLQASDGSGSEKPLTAPKGIDLSFASAPSDWSSDERFLLYIDLHEGTVLHLWVLPVDAPGNPHRLLHGDSADVEGQFSPNTHWVAYSSNVSGIWQVYVVPFPIQDAKARYQISSDGGQQPRWRQDGKELFFLSPDRRLMAVSVANNGSTSQFSAPKVLFQTHAHGPLTAEEFFTYDVSADGQRFLINENASENNPVPADIILNWADQLKR